ncbi:hypothetical protein VTI28DRAFT_4695 [Corynascus sepedonium]
MRIREGSPANLLRTRGDLISCIDTGQALLPPHPPSADRGGRHINKPVILPNLSVSKSKTAWLFREAWMILRLSDIRHRITWSCAQFLVLLTSAGS